jgi:hypothetical protein
MSEIPYPKLKYQGVPRAPLENHVQNPGYVYVIVSDPDAERALGDNWHDSPADAVRAVAKDAKITADQYELLAAQAVQRGAVAPAPPKFSEPAPAPRHHSNAPSDPAAQIPEPQDKQRAEGEWPRESERRKR